MVEIKKFSIGAESKVLEEFLEANQQIEIVDYRLQHLSELFKIRGLGIGDDWGNRAFNYLNENPDYGVAVYYPWKKRLCYVASEVDFVEVRTARNRNKISKNEQLVLAQKTIGIVGLSVGFSVFMAAVLERIATKIKIADFDELSLSNLNRLPFSSLDVGMTKVQLAYQWAMEIDPFLEVIKFSEGINTENIEEFFLGENPLNLVIDECDDGRIKLELRIKAVENGIPLLMETSDRGLLDVENYQNGESLFHGRLENFNIEELRKLTSRELIMFFVDISTASKRGKDSMLEIGKTLDTWPQLASDVLHGGGSVIIAARNLLLGNNIRSGRYFMDLQQKLGVDEY